MSHKALPVELSILPVDVKQALFQRSHYLLRPNDAMVLASVCEELGLPPEEARNYLHDVFTPNLFRNVSIEYESLLFESGCGVIDVWGPTGSGKSLLCRRLAEIAEKSYPDRMIYFVDCEGSFAKPLNDCIHHYRPTSWDQLVACINHIAYESHETSLVIVDSISFIFRHLLNSSPEESAFKGKILRHLIGILGRINRDTGSAVIVTNQTTTHFLESGVHEASFLVPCLGKQYQDILHSVHHKSIRLWSNRLGLVQYAWNPYEQVCGLVGSSMYSTQDAV
jgi:adenosyl cobinamide kinase/adenosyl cobinamide phosphate guanylyltransferase